MGGAGRRVGVPANAFCGNVRKCSVEITSGGGRAKVVCSIVICGRSGGGKGVSLTMTSSKVVHSAPSGSTLIFALCGKMSCRRAGGQDCRSASCTLRRIHFGVRRIVVDLGRCTFRESRKGQCGSRVVTGSLTRLRGSESSLNTLCSRITLGREGGIACTLSLSCTGRLSATGGGNCAGSFPLSSVGRNAATSRLGTIGTTVRSIREAVRGVSSCSERTLRCACCLEQVSLRSLEGFALSFTYFVFFFVNTPLKTVVEGNNLKAPMVMSTLFFMLC